MVGHHEVILDDAENDFVWSLRDIDPDEEFPPPERTQKLTDAGTVHLQVFKDSHEFVHVEQVPATELVFGFARVGFSIQNKLLSQNWKNGAVQPEKKFPSYVQNVTFTIDKSELSEDRRNELKEQFPGVVINEVDKCKPPPRYTSQTPSPEFANLDDSESRQSGRQHSVTSCSEATVTLPSSRPLRQVYEQAKDRTPSLSRFSNGGFTVESDLVDLAKHLGLSIIQPGDIWKMYEAWREYERIITFEEGSIDLQDYYVNLVDLNILARAIQDPALEFATLLRFQITNFEQIEKLPDLDRGAIRPFEHLPHQAPMCRWIAILFAYSWDTVETGDYEEFLEDNVGIDQVALSKFLYAVAYVRDPYTKGDNPAVLQHWCAVHSHAANSAEDQRCMTAERSCKNKLASLMSASTDKRKRPKKRPFAETLSPRRQRSTRNVGSRYGLRLNPRPSAAREMDSERDKRETSGSARSKNSNSADCMATETPKDRLTPQLQPTIIASPTTTPTDPPRRRPGRPRKHPLPTVSATASPARVPPEAQRSSPLNSTTMAAALSATHLESLPLASDFDLTRVLEEHQRPSTAKAARLETPRTSPAASGATPASERRSARAKAKPRGFFRELVPESEFGNTMWNVFKES